MIYRALEVIQIFLAGGRANGRTDRGVPRGPRGPKKDNSASKGLNGHWLNPDFAKVIVSNHTLFSSTVRNAGQGHIANR